MRSQGLAVPVTPPQRAPAPHRGHKSPRAGIEPALPLLRTTQRAAREVHAPTSPRHRPSYRAHTRPHRPTDEAKPTHSSSATPHQKQDDTHNGPNAAQPRATMRHPTVDAWKRPYSRRHMGSQTAWERGLAAPPSAGTSPTPMPRTARVRVCIGVAQTRAEFSGIGFGLFFILVFLNLGRPAWESHLGHV